MKRQEYISWDEFFIGVAELASRRSKDPDTRCGACIVNPSDNRIVSVGYNGLPRGLSDDGVLLKWENQPESFLKKQSGISYDYWKKPDKYEFSVHAEENAILNCSENLKGCHLYLYTDKGYYPCSKCARGIIQKGITDVIMAFATSENTDVYNWEFTKHMFKKAHVTIRVLSTKGDSK